MNTDCRHAKQVLIWQSQEENMQKWKLLGEWRVVFLSCLTVFFGNDVEIYFHDGMGSITTTSYMANEIEVLSLCSQSSHLPGPSYTPGSEVSTLCMWLHWIFAGSCDKKYHSLDNQWLAQPQIHANKNVPSPATSWSARIVFCIYEC